MRVFETRRWPNSWRFRNVVWLFPLAYVLHVLEELPGFTSWAKENLTTSFTMEDYVVIHLSGVVIAFVAALVIQFFQNRVVIFVFFAFVFTPAVCFNVLFHLGATAIFGVYSPGLLTALTLYPPVFLIISRLALREGCLSKKLAIVSFVVAGLFHAGEVSHNVFKAW